MNEPVKVSEILDTAIKDAKIKLYSLILAKQTDKLTDNEVDLGYCLAKDSDIQERLEAHHE